MNSVHHCKFSYSSNKLDRYSMLIVANYLYKPRDYINLVCVCKNFMCIPQLFHYNPIRIKSLSLFPNIQTQHLYTKKDVLLPVNQYVVCYETSYDKAMKAPSNFHFINIKYTKYDKKNYGNFSHTSFGETIQFPTSLIHIEPCCFLGCVSLTKITFPPFLKSISDDCFGNCYNLKEIDASSVFHFGNCFTNCTSLSSVTVSSNLTTVSPKWLSGCKSLQKITSYGLKSVTSLVSYHISTLFKTEGVKCHQIEYTSEDHQRYGNKIPYGYVQLDHIVFKFTISSN
ncbi:Leucine rich repeat containing protein BspA family protein [Entamoeba marina]